MSEVRTLIGSEDGIDGMPGFWIEVREGIPASTHYFVNDIEVTPEVYRDVIATFRAQSLYTLAHAAEYIDWQAVGVLVDRALENE